MRVGSRVGGAHTLSNSWPVGEHLFIDQRVYYLISRGADWEIPNPYSSNEFYSSDRTWSETHLPFWVNISATACYRVLASIPLFPLPSSFHSISIYPVNYPKMLKSKQRVGRPRKYQTKEEELTGKRASNAKWQRNDRINKRRLEAEGNSYNPLTLLKLIVQNTSRNITIGITPSRPAPPLLETHIR